MKYIVSFFAIMFFYTGYGQIVLYPEIGIAYSPYTIKYAYSGKKVNLLLGVSGVIPIHEKWYLWTRISYNKRESAEWRDCAISSCFNEKYTHSDINFDLGLFYRLREKVNIGVGPTIVQKINANYTKVNDDPIMFPPSNILHSDRRHFGLSGGVSIDFDFLTANFLYTRKFNVEYLVAPYFFTFESKSRLTCTIAIPINSGRK